MSLNKIDPTKTKAWKLLEDHFSEIKSDEIKTLINKRSSNDYHLTWNDFLVDISKNRINDRTLSLLFNLAEECGLKEAISKQFSGEVINQTENRAVLHTAIRTDGKEKIILDNNDLVPLIIQTRKKFKNSLMM